MGRLLPMVSACRSPLPASSRPWLNYWQMFSEAGARHCQGEQLARWVRGLAGGYEGLRRCLLSMIC
jgi:hypothetical protein